MMKNNPITMMNLMNQMKKNQNLSLQQLRRQQDQKRYKLLTQKRVIIRILRQMNRHRIAQTITKLSYAKGMKTMESVPMLDAHLLTVKKS